MKSIISRWILVASVLLIVLTNTNLAYAERLPINGSDNSTYGIIMNNYLRVSHTENGSLRNITIYGTGADPIAQINESGIKFFRLINITNDIVMRGYNLSQADLNPDDDLDGSNFSSSKYINITIDSTGITFSLNVSQSLCVALTGNAGLCDGADNTGGAPDLSASWRRVNASDYLDNATVVRTYNTSLLELGNVTNNNQLANGAGFVTNVNGTPVWVTSLNVTGGNLVLGDGQELHFGTQGDDTPHMTYDSDGHGSVALDTSNTLIIHTNTVTGSGSESPLLSIYRNHSAGQNLPLYAFSPGGPDLTSIFGRSLIIANDNQSWWNGSLNGGNILNGTNYSSTFSICGDLDYNTDTTGADLCVGGDFQVGDDIWADDTDGETHFLSRVLEIQDETMDYTVPVQMNNTLSENVLTIKEADGDNIKVVINEENTILAVSQDTITLEEGTNITPKTNYVHYTGSTPTLTAQTSDPGLVADLAQIKLGGNYSYGSIAGSAQQSEFVRNSYWRAYYDGSVYIKGFTPNVATDDINITTGEMVVVLWRKVISNNVTTSSAFEIQNGGVYSQLNTTSDFGYYSDGTSIANNKYFNVVCGVVNDDVTTNGVDEGIMWCGVQNTPTIEYISLSQAEVDEGNTLVVFPNDDLLKRIYVPVLRVVMQRTGTTNTIQTLSNGNLFFDLRGTATGVSGSAPSPAITDHGSLDGLTDDDHTQYLLRTGVTVAIDNGTIIRTANTTALNAGNVTNNNQLANGAGYLTAYVQTIFAIGDNISNSTPWAQVTDAPASSNFQYSNITLFLGVDNSSIIRAGNVTALQQGNVTNNNQLANGAGYFDAHTDVDHDQTTNFAQNEHFTLASIIGALWDRGNASDYLDNATVIRAGNVSALQQGNVTNNNQLANGASYLTAYVQTIFAIGDNISNVTAPLIGGLSDNLDNTDASIEWEDATDLDANGALSANVCDSAEIATGAVKDDEIDYTAVTLTDFPNDAIFTSNATDVQFRQLNVSTKNFTQDDGGANAFVTYIDSTGSLITGKQP